MAKDVKFLISANADRAEAELRKLQSTGQAVSGSLSKSFEALGIKSSAAFDAKRQAAQTAYDRIKQSGVATNDELARAQQALGQRLVDIDTDQYGKRVSLLDKFKANWVSVTAGIAGAWLVVSQGWDLANQAAKGIEQRQSFANLAASHGQNAQSILASLKAVSGETVSTRTLIEKSGTAMILGIPAEKLSSLMAVARASSKMTGQSVTDAYSDISLAVARGSRLILDNLGIIVSEEAAYKTYAATLGKTSGQLSDAEKKTAFLNATLAAGDDIIKRVGSTSDTMADKMARVTARMQDLKETVGVGVLSSLLVVDGAMRGAAAASLYLSSGIFGIISAASRLVGATDMMQEYRIEADAALAASEELAASGKSSLSLAMDTISGKIDPLNSKMAAFKNTAKETAEATEKLAESKKTAAANIASYAKEVDKLGSLQMKQAANGYSDDLKRQADQLKTNSTLTANLSAPLQQYLSVIDSVYGRQLDLQKQIGQALFKIGAEQKEIAQQNIQIAQVEKAAAESRLGAWQQYYDNLRAMNNSTIEVIKKSQTDLFNIQMNTKDLVGQVQQKLLSPMQQYYAKVQELEQKQQLAQQLGTDERIKLLQQVQQQWAGLSSEVKDGDNLLLSQAETTAAAINKIRAIGVQLEQEKAGQISQQQQQLQAIQASMAAASNMLTEYQNKVAALDSTIAGLTRTYSLTMKDEASPAIRAIKSELDQLRDKSITITAVYRSVSTDAALAPMGSYASGTDYVPKTGLYMLHRGEEVHNSARVTADKKTDASSGVVIQGGLNISLPNVTAADSQGAAEFARALYPELQKLARRQA